ncbi:MAG TPA: penicillin-binding protein activator [Arenimonas sp.]|nr:penicillin-binding protein activator [Arenimonas sp.]
MSRLSSLLLALLLAGCASVQVTREPGVAEPAAPAATPADRLAEDGRHAEAARAYTAEALSTRGREGERLWLYAADQHLLAGDAAAARQAWAESNRRRLDGRDLRLHDLLGAHFANADGRPGEALALLGSRRDGLPPALAARWHRERAQALAALGREAEAIGEQAWLATVATGRERAEAMQAIEQYLGRLQDEELAALAAALPTGDPLYLHAGRALLQRGLPLPRPFQRGAGQGLDGLPPADADGYRPPERLAALLPLSGPLAAAGQSVRDGLLAAYYGEGRRKPELRFYDTAGSDDGVLRAYGQALADDAGMIVGPLMRSGVDALFALPDPGLPLVALNRGQLPPPTGSTSFTLSPEEEGAAAADRLLERGLRRVLAVTQADENAGRALAAFRERLLARGGEIIGTATVSEENPDYVPALQSAQAGGLRPDALFLTLKAPQARLLSSQLDNAGLVGVPRLASSLILSGGNLRLDVELDGIEYPELPWLIGLRADLPDPDALGRQLPSAQGGGARLFAFGLDAWQLAAWLDHLQRDPGARVRGATGELSLDAQGNVQRRPAWAVFSGGRARPAPDGALLSDGFPGNAY